jgi:hypothetical protein
VIDRLEIMAVAAELSLRADVVEKDYVWPWRSVRPGSMGSAFAQPKGTVNPERRTP